MTLTLRSTLARLRQPQGALAAELGISRSAVNLILMRDRWPASRPRTEIEAGIRAFLQRHGATAAEVTTAFDPAAPDTQGPANTSEEDIEMFLGKQSLTPQARKHFGLFRSPFDEPRAIEDIWMGDSVRYVREAVWDTARNGGFRAVIGESGSGKSTIRGELADRILIENARVQVIEPYVLGLEDSETRGTPLRSTQIAEAIIAKLAPTQSPRQSPQRRFEQCHRALIDSSRAGYTNLLQIEEAHGLPDSTLKHLKRFTELKDGLRPVLGIVLHAQTELADRLSSRNLREVAQRLEIVTLEPLDADLPAYLQFVFGRAGKQLDDVVEPGTLDALAKRLMPVQRVRRGGREQLEPANLRYPLAVNNLLTMAMNEAAFLGAPRVSAKIVESC